MIIFCIILFSLAIGSFVGCLTYRISCKEESIFARSKCPKCKSILNWYNLIPLFSWIIQKGKCNNCKKEISFRYPIIEIIFTVSFLAIYFAFKIVNLKFFLLLLIVSIMITMSIVDIEEYFIPDYLQIFLVILTFFYIIDDKNLLYHFKSALIFFFFGIFLLLFFKITAKIDAIGIDDIKLLFSIGLFLGYHKFIFFIFLTGILGIIFGFMWKKFKKDEFFPFAPSLLLATIISEFIKFQI